MISTEFFLELAKLPVSEFVFTGADLDAVKQYDLRERLPHAEAATKLTLIRTLGGGQGFDWIYE